MTTEKKTGVRSNRELGRKRDGETVAAVEAVGSLAREQVQMLLFGSGKMARKKCQERLKVLTDRKKLKRGRCDVTDSYIYWLDKKPGHIEHRILLNWVYIAARAQGFTVKAYITEYYTGEQSVQPDALLVLADGSRYIPLFIEMQRVCNNSIFDKVPKYTDYFLSELWMEKEWPEKTENGRKRFNRILVVTDGGEKEKAKLEQTINDHNKKGLRFIVAALDEVIKDLRRIIL